MIHKSRTTTPDKVLVTFELPACIWATRIHVAGDFNNWNRASMPMCQERDGVWRASIELPMNTKYQFRYLVDGNWQTDYHADDSAPNGFGGENSTVDTGILPDDFLEETLALQVKQIHEAQIYEAQRLQRTHPVSRPAHAIRRAA